MSDEIEIDTDDLDRRMDGALVALRQEFATLRTGRASAAMVEPVMVDARDFGLGNAVELLESLAGLDSVSPVAAVSAYLVYER